MKVTIITPTFNSERFIEHNILSVKNQDYPYIEHIIIDGRSTDNTISILKKHENYINYISELDSGIYEAINKGIMLSTGDIIGILNSDDFFIDENVITRIINEFSQNNLNILMSNVLFVKRNNINRIVRYYSSKSFKVWMFKFGFQPPHPTFYIKKHLYLKYGMYNTDFRISGDFELMLRLLLKKRIMYKHVNDLWVVMRSGGISSSGLRSVISINSEILYAHKINKIFTCLLFIYLKYFFKWWGFVFKNK